MLYMVRDTKVSTVTPTSDLRLRGQRSKGKINIAKKLNYIRFCSGLLHVVWIDELNKKVNDDHQVKGQQKVIMGQ